MPLLFPRLPQGSWEQGASDNGVGGAGTYSGVSPALYQLHRGCAQHPVGKQVDFFHDVGQTHGQLLPEEGE